MVGGRPRKTAHVPVKLNNSGQFFDSIYSRGGGRGPLQGGPRHVRRRATMVSLPRSLDALGTRQDMASSGCRRRRTSSDCSCHPA